MRPFLPVLALVGAVSLGMIPTGAGATIVTTVFCSPATGTGQTGDESCVDSVDYGEQSIQTRASAEAGYGSAMGSASVAALWGTASAGGAAFVAEFTDTITVTVLTGTPVYAVFQAPLVTGAGSGSFGKINEFDLGLKRATVFSSSFLSVFSPFGSSFSAFASVTQTWQESPDGYFEDRVPPEAQYGRIALFSGLELTIYGRFAAGVDAFGSASASIGSSGGFGQSGTLAAMDGAAPIAGMYWQGITFETADGTPVSPDAVLLQSVSGTDWTLAAQPVPEPQTWALWAFGLGIVAARMRRTRIRVEAV